MRDENLGIAAGNSIETKEYICDVFKVAKPPLALPNPDKHKCVVDRVLGEQKSTSFSHDVFKDLYLVGQVDNKFLVSNLFIIPPNSVTVIAGVNILKNIVICIML